MLITWWFNPVIWFLNGQIRRVREDCCDDLVLAKNLSNENEYSQSLIEIAKVAQSPFTGSLATAFGMAEHPLGSRIRRIMNPTIRRLQGLTFASSLVVLTLGVICLPGIRIATANVGANTATEGVAPPREANSTTRESEDLIQLPEQDTAVQQADDSSANQKLRDKFQIEVIDSVGKPVVGAAFFASTWGEDSVSKKPKVVNENYVTDEMGLVSVELPDGLNGLRTWTSKKGHVTLFANWEDRSYEDVPERLILTMQPGTIVGGVVVDPAGLPIEGAVVEVSRSGGGKKLDTNANTRLGTWLSNGDDAVVTDKDGRWQIDNVPAGDDLQFRFKVTQPKYITETQWKPEGHFKVSLEELRDKTARFTPTPNCQEPRLILMETQLRTL